jgi:hypothetical protein
VEIRRIELRLQACHACVIPLDHIPSRGQSGNRTQSSSIPTRRAAGTLKGRGGYRSCTECLERMRLARKLFLPSPNGHEWNRTTVSSVSCLCPAIGRRGCLVRVLRAPRTNPKRKRGDIRPCLRGGLVSERIATSEIESDIQAYETCFGTSR